MRFWRLLVSRSDISRAGSLHAEPGVFVRLQGDKDAKVDALPWWRRQLEQAAIEPDLNQMSV